MGWPATWWPRVTQRRQAHPVASESPFAPPAPRRSSSAMASCARVQRHRAQAPSLLGTFGVSTGNARVYVPWQAVSGRVHVPWQAVPERPAFPSTEAGVWDPPATKRQSEDSGHVLVGPGGHLILPCEGQDALTGEKERARIWPRPAGTSEVPPCVMCSVQTSVQSLHPSARCAARTIP